jgi:hypothetical protein
VELYDEEEPPLLITQHHVSMLDHRLQQVMMNMPIRLHKNHLVLLTTIQDSDRRHPHEDNPLEEMVYYLVAIIIQPRQLVGHQYEIVEQC